MRRRKQPENQPELFPVAIEKKDCVFAEAAARLRSEEKFPLEVAVERMENKAPVCEPVEKPVNKVAEALQAKMAIKAARKASSKAAPVSKFERGHNTLCACRGCGKRTHSSIDGNLDIRLCRECYEANLCENDHLDGHPENNGEPVRECKHCIAEGAFAAPAAPAAPPVEAPAKKRRAPGAGRKTLDNRETLRRPISIPAAMWHTIQVCSQGQGITASELIRRAVAQALGGEIDDIQENQG